MKEGFPRNKSIAALFESGRLAHNLLFNMWAVVYFWQSGELSRNLPTQNLMATNIVRRLISSSESIILFWFRKKIN